MKIVDKIRNNNILKNISWILSGRVVNMLLSLVVGLLSARYLGPSNYGIIGYAGSYTTFFAAICSLGIGPIIIKEFVDAPEEEGKVLGTSIVLRLISCTLSYIIIQGVTFVWDAQEPVTKAVVALYSINIFFQAFDLLKYWFQKRLQSKYCEIISIIAYILVSIYKIALLVMNLDVKWFAVSASLDYAIIAIALMFVYFKQGGQKFCFELNTAKRIISRSYHFIISGMMIALFNSTDRFMLKHMVNEVEVGYYTTALNISGLCSFVLSAIITSVSPAIIEAHKEDEEKYKKLNKKLYTTVFYVSVLIAIAFLVFSTLIVKVLYGQEYIGAASPLRILSWYIAFSYLGVARDSWIVCENKQKYLKYIYFGAAFLNILINYILIPKFGAAGASLASLVTQISTILIFPLCIKELRPNVRLMLDAILLKGIRKKS